MNPEQLAELWAWYQARKTQQLSYPVDEASKNALDAITYGGTSAHALTTTISIPSGGGSATVAALPTGFIVISVEGALHTIATYD